MLHVTVCICAFNAGKYIITTLESLDKQTCKEFSLLILDDGSSDQTAEVVKTFLTEKKWQNFELISMPENRGTAYCRDFALRHVATPLMMFFDSDDIAKPELVEKLYNKINSDDSLIAVSCYCNYMDSKGKPLGGGLYLGPKNKEEFLAKAESGKMIFFPIQTLFKREYALKAGGYRQAEWFPTGKIRYQDQSEDVDLWGRMSDFYKEGKWMVTIPEVLFLYRKRTESLSANFTSARVMGQKLMYIKANQKRRRTNLPELKFQEYWDGLSFWAKLQFERRTRAAHYYRQACFAWVNRKLFRCAWFLGLGALLSPMYPLEKYKANFRKDK